MVAQGQILWNSFYVEIDYGFPVILTYLSWWLRILFLKTLGYTTFRVYDLRIRFFNERWKYNYKINYNYLTLGIFSDTGEMLTTAFVAATAKSLQSCPTLCDPIDSSPPGSPVPGILQARTLEWLPSPSPMHESEKWKWSRSVMSNSSWPLGLQPTRLLPPWDFPGKSTGVGCHCLLQTTAFQSRSVAQSCLTLCDPMNRSTPGLPVYHQRPEFTQTHVHQVSDAIQSSHPLSSASLPAPNPSQHQSLFQWVNSLHEVAKVLEFQL